MSFAKFLVKHATELNATALAVETILDAITLPPHAKDSVLGVVAMLKSAAENVANAAAAEAKATTVKISKKDVTDAIKDMVPSVTDIEAMIEAAIKAREEHV